MCVCVGGGGGSLSGKGRHLTKHIRGKMFVPYLRAADFFLIFLHLPKSTSDHVHPAYLKETKVTSHRIQLVTRQHAIAHHAVHR